LGVIALAAWRRDYIPDAKDIFIDATEEKPGTELPLEALCNFGYLFLEKYEPTLAIGVFRIARRSTRCIRRPSSDWRWRSSMKAAVKSRFLRARRWKSCQFCTGAQPPRRTPLPGRTVRRSFAAGAPGAGR